MSYLSFLCARLLDLQDETRAAQVTQAYWRRKCSLKKDVQLYKLLFHHHCAPCQLKVMLAEHNMFLQEANNEVERQLCDTRALVESASVGETTPPLRHWTRDDIQVTRIERLFPLSNTLEAEPPFIGAALVFVLLGNLYKRNDRLSISMLQGPKCPGIRKVHVTLEVLPRAGHQGCIPSLHFLTRTREFISRAGKDVKTCLETDFMFFESRVFANVKFRDINKSKRITWRSTLKIKPCPWTPELFGRGHLH
ncbi:uncharacterized protein LOC115003915 [Cottoperca gobio]|uniref:Uncharacterized protein LOC115003915 n=1 Tax=Cottoperca gobio TaxID=56716 RepID=A0A6J2P8M5_COTGO|nr:uncharacterized protein LOC115003915 [Cottoperca gobio]